jgi:hypothetical protein
MQLPVNRRPATPRFSLKRLCRITAVAAIPPLLVVLAGPAQAQLARQTFEVNLGSGAIPGPLPFDEPFFLGGPASENLLEVRLWVERERDLSKENCPSVRTARVSTASEVQRSSRVTTPADLRVAARDSARRGRPIPLPMASTWSRARLDSLTRFELKAGPLSPNRDYTFCFHLLRRPTSADSAAFRTLAAKNIGAALARRAAARIDSLPEVDTLQKALIDALPRADTVVFLDSVSVFQNPVGETESRRLIRLNRLVDVASAYLQWSKNHRRFLASDSARVAAARDSLEALTSDTTLVRLAALALDRIPVELDTTRLMRAAILAPRIAQLRGTDLDAVARGAHPLDGSPVPGAISDREQIATSSTLTPFVENLSRTLSVLRDLGALTALIRERRSMSAGEEAALARLATRIEHAGLMVRAEMNSVLNLSASLDQRNAQVQELASSVGSLDFARIALRSTTSDTYKARANMYISLDAGLLRASEVDQMVPYLGVNLYLRPVNKNAPLGWCPCLGRRLSLTMGITTSSIADKDRIDDTFKGHSIFTGVGARLTDYWRVSGGLLLLRTYRDEAPVDLRFGAVPSLATSLDIDVVGLLGKAGTLLFP